MADLWDAKREKNRQAAQPLAARMRPTTLDQFVGQRHLLAPGKPLRRMLQADRMTSVIFYGPPGTGKTTLAGVIAHHTQRRFERANAATVGVKDVRLILERAARSLGDDNTRTILFLDEIHRFSRSQQDVLLADVERGTITLIGATTENPFFSVNAPLVSRSQIFQFHPLDEQDILTLLRTAATDPERGLGSTRINITDDALNHWARISDGDARRALTALEIAVASGGKHPPDTPRPSDDTSDNPPPIQIDLAVAEQSIQQKAVVYDPAGDQHYDTISAFIKSIRGTDPDAAVYWLAKMITAGEDPRFIARRLAILASEDIGNADPQALVVAAAAFDVTERIGLPECQLTLAQATIYLATAPKSNASATAVWDAMKDVREGRTIPVPKHLRDAHYRGATRLGHGDGYQYPHNAENAHVQQEYLGVDKTYYTPTDRGYERHIAKFLQQINTQNPHTPPPTHDHNQPPTTPPAPTAKSGIVQQR